MAITDLCRSTALGLSLHGIGDQAVRGMLWLDLRIGRFIMEAIDETANVFPLSPGELRAAQMFAQGQTSSQIAEALTLSRYTVRNQLSTAYRKLEVHSKVEMARTLSGGMRGASYF